MANALITRKGGSSRYYGGVGLTWQNGNGGTSDILDTQNNKSKKITAVANNVHELSNKNVYIQGSNDGKTWNNIWKWGSGSYNCNYGGNGAIHSGNIDTTYRYFRITTDGNTSGWGSYGTAAVFVKDSGGGLNSLLNCIANIFRKEVLA